MFERFGENFGDVVFRWNFFNENIFLLNILAKEMVADFDVFGTRVLHGALAQVDGSFVVAHDWNVVEVSEAVKDTVQDIGDIDGNFFKESSSVINAKVMNNFQSVQEEEICDSGQSDVTKGGSVLGVLEEVIRVGQEMGYSIEGCEKDIESIIRNQGDDGTRVVYYVFGRRRFSRKISSKRVLWDYMSVLLSQWNGEVIMMGDFNEVQSRDERRGSWFNPSSARVFNQFISSSGLVDIKMEGYTFTWSHPSATKMSKLDRFLVSDGIFLEFPSISALCLDRHLSDHHPILLRDVQLDFGPVPFRFYHSWFSFDGFDDMVERTWRSFSHSDGNGMIRFKKKIQELKVIIRRWIIDKRFHMAGSKIDIINELQEIDKELDQGVVSDKSKVRWAIEGDKNSKFFHGIINKKRSQLAICGVFIDGCWCTDPILVKEAFHDHFEARFRKPITNRLKLNFPFNKRLLHDQAADLERRVSRDEIRMAVWNYGENKSPGPDGFTFEFFRRYWDFVGLDFCEAVEHFFVNGLFSKGCNSSFVALIPKVMDAKFVNDYRPISLIGSVYKVVTKILANHLAMVITDIVSDTQSAFIAERQILDGPFILNEVLHWCKRKNKKAMFLKSTLLRHMIRYCGIILLMFSRRVVLVRLGVNRFEVHFVLLRPQFCRAVKEGLFKGICLNGSVSISHLFYADDAMFIGEWNKEWADVVLKIRSRLSKWKVKTLSIGGRLTLLKLVLGASSLYTMSIFKVPRGVLKEMETIRNHFFNGADPLGKKITWVAWDKVLVAKIKGGLGVSSFYALNRALVLKWVWRVQLIRRGVTLESTNCPLCRLCEEDIHHVLFRCDVARTVLRHGLHSRIGIHGFLLFGFPPK
nr:putative RNA-directed DNA polymerase, eukaryota, reverse transcriptase zinc-binding domain protein [Tanacetum cinerariifolium]